MTEDPREKALNETLKCLDAAIGTPRTLNKTMEISRDFRDEDFTSLLDATAPLTGLYSEVSLNETPAAILVQDDPGVKAAQVLFSEFVDAYVTYSSDAQIWDEIAAYERVCARQAESLKKIIRKVPRHHSNFAKTEQMALKMVGERNTWRLLGSLFYERLNGETNENDQPMIDTTRDKTDQAIIAQLYDSSAFIREAQNVVDWLEKNAEDDYEGKYFDSVEYFGNTHVAWENTLRSLKSEKERGFKRGGNRFFVNSLDPDAPLRQGKKLHDLDQEEDHRLVRCMFACVRAGQICDAQDLCAKSGQQWRAASLEGWKLYHDQNNNDSQHRNPVVGNQYRDVWKAVAWKTASDTRLIPEERAMYGSLCGHLPAMLLMCNKWEDQLWAYFRTLVDQRVEETLRGNSLHLRSLHPLPKDYPEEKLTLEGIFKSIESRLGIQNLSFYHIIQKYLILNNVDDLIKTSHEWVTDGGLSPHLLRCLTHLLLVLKRFGRVSYELQDQVNDILYACVKEAMERGDVEQVARYSSVLPEWLQTRSYADFLINICEEHHRKHALSLASCVGLDTAAITATVVAKIRLAPGTDVSNELIGDTSADDKVKLNALDWLLYDKVQRPEALRQASALIRVFLISRKVTAAKAVFQKVPSDSIDVIVKLQLSKTGKTDLPTYYDNRVREYLCYKAFLHAQESFTDWFDHYHQKKPAAVKKPRTDCSFPEQLAYDHALQQYNTDFERWNHALDLITKKATERLYNVLLFPDGGWLVDSAPLPADDDDEERSTEEEESTKEPFWNPLEEGKSLDMAPEDKGLLQHLEPQIAIREPSRAHQLTTLRSIFIPQVTSLLQNILHCTKNYKDCVQLADLIASEQYGLYKCFGSGEMQRFLFKMQDSCKELLDKNCDALGYSLR